MTHISLRGPGDVLAVLPYQLGYHPRRSVVVVALEERRVGLVVRVDLPPEGHEAAVAAAVVGPLRRERVARVIVLGYEDAPDESLPLVLRIVEDLESGGVDVAEVDVVRDGRRYSPVCSEPCCPPDGRPVPDPDEVPAVAELIALGRAPLADRDAVDRLVDPDPAWSARLGAPLSSVTGEPVRRRREAVRAWATLLAHDAGRVAHGGAPGRPRHVAAAVVGLRDIALRDALIGWLAPSVLPRDALDPDVVALLEHRMPRWGGMGRWSPGHAEAGEHDLLLDRLVAVCRCIPDDRPRDAAAACTVAAQVAWAGGDGARARAALDRALRLDPGYRLAGLLARVVDHGLRLEHTPPGHPLGRAG